MKHVASVNRSKVVSMPNENDAQILQFSTRIISNLVILILGAIEMPVLIE